MYYEIDYIFYRYAVNLFKNYRKALRPITLNYITGKRFLFNIYQYTNVGKCTCIGM